MIDLKIGNKEKHEISPYLYMQFMEPLGACDSSVDAAWDYIKDDWCPEVIDKVRELAPTMVRFGGCLSSYYRWKEAVGPMNERVPMINYFWGGIYSNHVGTHEFVDFCRKVNAEPLMVVNMESDGRRHLSHPSEGVCRLGTANEAAEWVLYCNDPANELRLKHGIKEPYNIKYWQIGNETSYCPTGFTSSQCIDATRRFATAMREADPSIKLIGWGDNFRNDKTWCSSMSKLDEIDMIAFHHHFDSGLPSSPLYGTKYRENYELTFEHLLNAYKSMDAHIQQMRSECRGKRLAMTEGHFAIPGRNRNEVLSSWGAGVAYARCHNVISRNSDILDIATMADFFGTVWQVNAILIPNNVPLYNPEPNIKPFKPYLQPVASVMSLFCKHQGKYAVDVDYNGAVDVVASKTDNTVYLHVANTDMNTPQTLYLNVGGKKIISAEMFYIAAKADTEITYETPDCFAVRKTNIEGNSVILPPAAVAAIEMVIEI